MKNEQEIIAKLKQLYGEKYDYSLIEWMGSKNKIKLICPKHGVFEKRVDHLMHGCGCSECRKEEGIIKEKNNFLKKAKEVHGDKYDYSKVEYVNSQTKVCIICPKHGEFWLTPSNHVNMKQGCRKCYTESRKGVFKMSLDEFIQKAKEIHGDKYDYSKSVYQGLKQKIKIICPNHGEFWQVAYDHLRGFGCEQCKYQKNTYTKKQFIERASQIHGDKYDYSKVKYINNHTKVCIICPVHGEFWQTPLDHLLGCGCQKCNYSHLENELSNILNTENINYIGQYKPLWLGKQTLDFYLQDYNIAIECQGMQHFKPIDYFGGESGYTETLLRDERKRKLCKENGIKLLYYSNLGINYPYRVFESKEDLLKEIIKV